MADTADRNQDRQEQALLALDRLHAEAVSRLADLKKRQLGLYRRVSDRLDQLAAKKALDSIDNR